MRIAIVGLLLSLAVLLSSIELSSQSESGSHIPWKILRERSSASIKPSQRMNLPHPFYYDSNGIIRSRDLKEARPIMDLDKDFFFGMAKGEHFFPIIENGVYKVFNLRDHTILPFSQEKFEKILAKTIFPSIRSSQRSGSPSKPPSPSTILQLRPPGPHY